MRLFEAEAYTTEHDEKTGKASFKSVEFYMTLVEMAGIEPASKVTQ